MFIIDKNSLIVRRPTDTEMRILEGKGLRNCTVEVIIYNDEFVGFINYDIVSEYVIKIELFQIFDKFKRRGLGTKAMLYFKQKYKNFSFCGTVLYPIAYVFWNSLIDNYNLNMELDFNEEDINYTNYK